MKRKLHISKPIKRKLLRWTFGILAGFIVLIIVGYILVRSNIDTLEAYINKTLAEQINGKVTIGDIDVTIFDHFPHFSLSVKDIVVEDPRYAEHQLHIFTAKRVFIQIRVIPLLKKNVELSAITMKDAEINLLRLKDGLLNSKGLVKPKKEVVPAEEKTGVLISKIYLENVHVNYIDEVWGKKFDLTFKDSFAKLANGDSISKITTKDKIYVAGLTFKPDKGSCLTDKTLNTKLELEWNRVTHTVLIKPSTAVVDRNKFTLSGLITPGITPHLEMEIKTNSIKMDYASTLVSAYTREKINGYNFKDPIPLSIKVEGAFNPGLPMKMDLYFNVKDNTFTTPTKTFDDVSLVGHYFNHLNDTLINDEKNSGVTFTRFKATYEGIPILMDMRVTDLTDPYMAIHINSNVHLTEANAAIDTSIIIFTAGDLKLDIDFKGKLNGYIEKEKESMDAVINGSATVTNAGCNLPQKFYYLNDINANIVFNERAMQIEKLNFNINKNPVNITATVSQFIYVIFFPNSKLQAEATVTAANFNLDNFRKPTASKKGGTQGKKIAGIVTSTLQNLEGNLSINANKVTFHKLIAENVKGKVTLGNSYINCKGVSMNAAGGNFTLDGNIDGIGSPNPTVNLYTTISGADISSLFYQLDNFNQTAVTSANLKGKLDAQVSFSSALNKSFLVDAQSMKGELNLVVREGELLNMASLNEISKNVFKKKDFSDIQFAVLKTVTSLDGKEFNITEMEIQSNILALYINGVYSFGDNTELFIKVPVKSLKTQEDDYIAEYKDDDDKAGMSINLKATKQNGKLKVSPLIFRKKEK